MDLSDEKRKMIAREIEHWRSNRLLPEHYCDFLLNLYRDPDKSDKTVGLGPLKINPARIRNSHWIMWVLVIFTLCAISFAVLNFNAFPLPMQIGLSVLLLAFCYGWAGMKRRSEPVAAYILLGTASLYVLFIGVYLLKERGLDSAVFIVGYVVFCSIVWLLTGLASRLALFQICGWISLVFCYGWLLHHHLGTVDWLSLELSWLPLAVLFCWLAWMLHEKSRQAGLVFFVLGLIVWYMPELYGMLYAEVYGGMTVQWMLLIKLATEGALLYAGRKKWTEWVV